MNRTDKACTVEEQDTVKKGTESNSGCSFNNLDIGSNSKAYKTVKIRSPALSHHRSLKPKHLEDPDSRVPGSFEKAKAEIRWLEKNSFLLIFVLTHSFIAVIVLCPI